MFTKSRQRWFPTKRKPSRQAGFSLAISNGNAYEEGLSEGWNPIQRYWKEPTPQNRAALKAFLAPEATKWQYTHGIPYTSRAAPESYTLETHAREIGATILDFLAKQVGR